ncbi:MAG: hypothetical protein RSB00_04450, partial [Bacilli bacterium]
SVDNSASNTIESCEIVDVNNKTHTVNVSKSKLKSFVNDWSGIIEKGNKVNIYYQQNENYYDILADYVFILNN